MQVRRLEEQLTKLLRRDVLIEEIEVENGDHKLKFPGGRFGLTAGSWVVTESIARKIAKFFGLKHLPSVGYEMSLRGRYEETLMNEAGRYRVDLKNFKILQVIKRYK